MGSGSYGVGDAVEGDHARRRLPATEARTYRPRRRPDARSSPDGVLVQVSPCRSQRPRLALSCASEPVIAESRHGPARSGSRSPAWTPGVVDAVGADETEFQPGDEVLPARRAGPPRTSRARTPVRPQAGGSHARGGGGHPGREHHRPPGSAGQGPPVRSSQQASSAGGPAASALRRPAGVLDRCRVMALTTSPDGGSSPPRRASSSTAGDPVGRWGDGFDVVIDHGGLPSVRSLAARLRPGGTMVLVGAAPGRPVAALARVAGATILSRLTGKTAPQLLAHPVKADLLVLKGLAEAGGSAPSSTTGVGSRTSARRWPCRTLGARGRSSSASTARAARPTPAGRAARVDQDRPLVGDDRLVALVEAARADPHEALTGPSGKAGPRRLQIRRRSCRRRRPGRSADLVPAQVGHGILAHVRDGQARSRWPGSGCSPRAVGRSRSATRSPRSSGRRAGCWSAGVNQVLSASLIDRPWAWRYTSPTTKSSKISQLGLDRLPA